MAVGTVWVLLMRCLTSVLCHMPAALHRVCHMTAALHHTNTLTHRYPSLNVAQPLLLLLLYSSFTTPQSQACPHCPLKQWAALKWVDIGSVQISNTFMFLKFIVVVCTNNHLCLILLYPPPPSQCSVWKVWTGCEDLLGSVVSRKWRLCLWRDSALF